MPAEQLDLFGFASPESAPTRAHGCLHGLPLTVPCLGCVEDNQRAIAEYRAAQARGEYDHEGYKPHERRRGRTA